MPTDLFYEATDDANPCSTGVGDRDNGYFEPFLGSQNKFVRSDLRGYPGPHLRNSLPKPEAGETTNYLWHWSLKDTRRGWGRLFLVSRVHVDRYFQQAREGRCWARRTCN